MDRRNALHLTSAGFTVDAVDLSPAAITWTKDRAQGRATTHQPHLPPGGDLPTQQCRLRASGK